MFTDPDYFDTKAPENFYKPIYFLDTRNVVESGSAAVNERGGEKVRGAIFRSVSGNLTGELSSSFYLEIVSLVLPVRDLKISTTCPCLSMPEG